MIELYKCQKCGKSVFEKFGSGKFCSRACANSRKFSSETNEKRRISNKRAFERNPELRKICSINAQKLNNRRYNLKNDIRPYIVKPERLCSVCYTKIKFNNKAGLCRHCLRTTEQGKAIMAKNAKTAADNLVASGKHQGWKTRNISSYAEKFWIRVLDNNGISYKREFTAKYGEKPNERYFLDFLIQKNNVNIDLEIDGKQHQHEDRKKHDEVRDKRLSDCGYIVYRIKWNEVNSEKGKLEMKGKINNFLEYLNSI